MRMSSKLDYIIIRFRDTDVPHIQYVYMSFPKSVGKLLVVIPIL